MKVEIKFKVDVPDVGATEQEIEDWIRFSFGDNGQIDGLNPLLDQHGDAEPIFGTFGIEWNC